MIEMIPFSTARLLIELGGGTGAVSDALYAKKRAEAELLIFEPDEEFFRRLCKKFSRKKNIAVIQESAERLREALKKLRQKTPGCVVSSLPFATLGEKTTKVILNEIRNSLPSDGRFVFYQYTPLRLPLIFQYFRIERFAFVALNAPPALVFLCSPKPVP